LKGLLQLGFRPFNQQKHHHSIPKLSSGSPEKSSDRTVTFFGIPKQFYTAPKMFATPANIFGMAQNIFEMVNQSLYVTNDLNGYSRRQRIAL
jgi:hypothetical protein